MSRILELGNLSRKGSSQLGQDVRVVSEIITPRKAVQTISDLSGIPIKLREVSKDDFENAKNDHYGFWAK